jgi:hypothetical protein
MKIVVRTYQSVLKRSHDNEDFSASTGDNRRVIEALSAKVYQ